MSKKKKRGENVTARRTCVVRMTLAPVARILAMRSLVMSISRCRMASSLEGSSTRTCTEMNEKGTEKVEVRM